MINAIWGGMLVVGILWAGAAGAVEKVTEAVFTYASRGLTTSLNLMAIIVVWFGISRVAEKAGLLQRLARLMTPLLRPLFPDVPRGHRALSSISMNLVANVFGLAHGATPFGLKAMKELQALNRDRRTISPPMVTFLALNTSIATLVPTTAVALRAQAGAPEPSAIIIPAALASSCAMVSVLVLDRLLRSRVWRRRDGGR